MLEGGASSQNLVHYPKDRIYNGLYREKDEKSFCLKPHGQEP